MRKINHAVWIVGVLAVALANECHSGVNGADDFNRPSKDTNKWGTDLTNGAGLLTQTNGHLQFTTTGTPTQTDFAGRPWILNYGSYTQNWDFRVDVNVPLLALVNTQYVGLLITVFPGSDPSMLFTNSFSMELRQNSAEHSFKSQIRVLSTTLLFLNSRRRPI